MTRSQLSTILAVACALALAPAALAQGYLCAEGGGSIARSDWKSPIFEWMIAKAGKGCRVAILGAPDDPANPSAPEPSTAAPPPNAPDRLAQKFLDAGASAVEDLWITRRDADKADIAAKIASCRIVFMRGGSQTEYVQWWNGTATERAIRGVFDAGGVIGGSSAGCAVLGEMIYDAAGGSCGPLHALRDARTPRLTYTTDFLTLAPGVLFDTHLTERGRLARLAVMLAHARLDLKKDILAIGVDPRTAVCVSPDGTAEVLGAGSVTLARLTPKSQLVIEKGKPPVVTDIDAAVLLHGAKVKLPSGEIIGGPAPLNKDQLRERDSFARDRNFRSLRLDGADPDDCYPGSYHLPIPEEPRAIADGTLTITDGKLGLPGVIIQTRTYDQSDHAELRSGGLLYAMGTHPGLLGLWLTRGNRAETTADGLIRIHAPAAVQRDGSTAPVPPASAVLIESAEATFAGLCTWKTRTDSPGPRKFVALGPVTVHVLAPGWTYNARSRKVTPAAVR